MQLSNNTAVLIVPWHLLVVVFLGSSQIAWTKPTVGDGKFVSSIEDISQEVSRGGHAENVVASDLNSHLKTAGTQDAAKRTREAQVDREGLKSLTESLEKPEHLNDVSKDTFAPDGAASAGQTTAVAGCWSRLKGYFRGLWSKLLYLFGKLDAQKESQLLQENKLSEYVRLRHGIGQNAVTSSLDDLGFQTPKMTLPLDVLSKRADILADERSARLDRWEKIPRGRPEANFIGLGALNDLQKRGRAIKVETAALQEEIWLMDGIVSGKVAESGQRLRIAEALHRLAERYREAITNPAMAKIALYRDKPYDSTRDRWFEMRKKFRLWKVEQAYKVLKHKTRVRKAAIRKKEEENTIRPLAASPD